MSFGVGEPTGLGQATSSNVGHEAGRVNRKLDKHVRILALVAFFVVWLQLSLVAL